MTAAAMQQDPAASMKPLPAPLVRLTECPSRFVKNKVVLLIDAVIFAYIGTLIIAASYYLLFETTSIMSNWWHRTVPNGDFRHAIRDVGEGLLGGLLAQHIVRNRYKKLNKAVTLNWLDKLEIHLHIANVKDDTRLSGYQLAATPFLVIIYGAVGFFASLGVIYEVRHNVSIHKTLSHWFSWLNAVVRSQTPGHAQSYLSKVQASLTDAWPNKLSGYAAAFFFGRRPSKGVMDDMQLWLCEQRYLRYQLGAGKLPWYYKLLPPLVKGHIHPMSPSSPPPWYYPPTWKATFNDIGANGVAPNAIYHPTLSVALIPILLLAGACLAGYGFYVLTFLATS